MIVILSEYLDFPRPRPKAWLLDDFGKRLYPIKGIRTTRKALPYSVWGWVLADRITTLVAGDRRVEVELAWMPDPGEGDP